MQAKNIICFTHCEFKYAEMNFFVLFSVNNYARIVNTRNPNNEVYSFG